MSGAIDIHLPERIDTRITGRFSLEGVNYGPVDLGWGWRDREHLWLAGLDNTGAVFVLTGRGADQEIELSAPRISARVRGKRRM